MLRNPKFFRAAMFVFGLALAFPVAMTLTSDVASASGYIFMVGLQGNGECVPAVGNDC